MTDYSKENFVLNEAMKRASESTTEFLENFGDRDCCGFAWVTIHPANCRMAKAAVALGIAHKNYAGGVRVHNPSKSGTQALSALECGAESFVQTLRSAGFMKAYMNSRMD